MIRLASALAAACVLMISESSLPSSSYISVLCRWFISTSGHAVDASTSMLTIGVGGVTTLAAAPGALPVLDDSGAFFIADWRDGPSSIST
eukprot:CAMPEP_0119485890 /NCGR_PEP_ID=MMETSP1344-20130328/12452_1 /TAXON_ID=236787 /ORGANISM="Florenciella parvula, Strain CCMP2471" /LENGTH=89 /DNA_ID=CAMNT_0007520595 /DNA_START=157 /DNA_END=426 /DNA_ORIENTATION=+